MSPGGKLCTVRGEGKDMQERGTTGLRAARGLIGDFWDAASGRFQLSIAHAGTVFEIEISIPLGDREGLTHTAEELIEGMAQRSGVEVLAFIQGTSRNLSDAGHDGRQEKCAIGEPCRDRVKPCVGLI